MAKSFTSLTARKFTSAEPEDDNNLQYIAPIEIQTAEPFKSLFAIKEDVHNAIVASMKENGYDETQPVIIWKERNILIDGHTRRKAAVEAGLKQIPYLEKSFSNEDEVCDYMFRLQFGRRNVTDRELVPLAIRALEGYEKKHGAGSKAEFLSQKFKGLSEAKAKQLSRVLEKATPEQIQKITEGQLTIRSAYMSLKNEKVTRNFLEDSDSINKTPKDKDIQSSKQPKATIHMQDKKMYMNIDGNESILLTFEGPLLIVPDESRNELRKRIIDAVKKVVESSFGMVKQ